MFLRRYQNHGVTNRTASSSSSDATSADLGDLDAILASPGPPLTLR
jgi:hypothetical protein